MAMKILIVVLRSICSYVVMLILGKLIGRKLISSITYFNFIVGVTLGSLAVRIALGSESSILLSIISAAVIVSLDLASDKLNLKSLSLSRFFEGEPVILVSGGCILDANLKKARISVSKLNMMLREKNIFNFSDVEIAVIESNGELSVLPTCQKQLATAGDLCISRPAAKMPIDVIIDGHVLCENLKSAGREAQWLDDELKSKNLVPEVVFYAGLDTLGNLYISVRGQK